MRGLLWRYMFALLVLTLTLSVVRVSLIQAPHIESIDQAPLLHVEEAPRPNEATILEVAAKDVGLKTEKQFSVGACSNYRGILHIRGGDLYAAAGTLFFVYIVNHILYARMHNLLPWIHLSPDGVCFDLAVHGNESTSIVVPRGVASTEEIRWLGKRRGCGNPKRPLAYPGNVTESNTTQTSLDIFGNGIWGSYFDPLVEFDWEDDSCRGLPVVEIPSKLVSPGIHRCAPWAVRPWRVRGMPKRMEPYYQSKSVHDWFGSMRSMASEIVALYYRPQAWLQQEIESANPAAGKCLAMHIRMTDKAHGREKISLETFLPYAMAYSEVTHDKIYIATDDSRILSQINATWPPAVAARIVYRQDTLRSQDNKTSVFDVFATKRHRTNTEALVEIYAMSKCNYIVHGFSAMAEAAIYLNYRLHDKSVCLDTMDEEKPLSASQFRSMVAKSSTR